MSGKLKKKKPRLTPEKTKMELVRLLKLYEVDIGHIKNRLNEIMDILDLAEKD